MKRIFCAALALFFAGLAVMLTPVVAMADEAITVPDTKTMYGCEWQRADNGNYWFKVDGGCAHWTAMGYSSAHDLYGKDEKEEPAKEPEPDGPDCDDEAV